MPADLDVMVLAPTASTITGDAEGSTRVLLHARAGKVNALRQVVTPPLYGPQGIAASAAACAGADACVADDGVFCKGFGDGRCWGAEVIANLPGPTPGSWTRGVITRRVAA